jgi:uncharacterized protein YuzE
MKLEYDAEADAAYIRFSETRGSRTEEESDVCINESSVLLSQCHARTPLGP